MKRREKKEWQTDLKVPFKCSLKLLLLAAVIGLPIGLMAGVYLAEFGGKIFSFITRYTTDLLNVTLKEVTIDLCAEPSST